MSGPARRGRPRTGRPRKSPDASKDRFQLTPAIERAVDVALATGRVTVLKRQRYVVVPESIVQAAYDNGLPGAERPSMTLRVRRDDGRYCSVFRIPANLLFAYDDGTVL